LFNLAIPFSDSDCKGTTYFGYSQIFMVLFYAIIIKLAKRGGFSCISHRKHLLLHISIKCAI